MKLSQFMMTILTLAAINMASCTDDENEAPEINIRNISISGQGKSIDNLFLGDTVTINLNLQSTKKELSSFSCKYKDVSTFWLSITELDTNTTTYEGSMVATAPDEDCTITFKDGTYNTDITVVTVIEDAQARTPQLTFYLFSKKETTTKELNFTINYQSISWI